MERLYENDEEQWIIGGDFNEIWSDEEKKGGSKRKPKQMREFREAINRCRLIDAGFGGDKYGEGVKIEELKSRKGWIGILSAMRCF